MTDRLTILGLREAEARQRWVADGPNVIAGRTRPPTLTVALDALREPMFIMLVAGGGDGIFHSGLGGAFSHPCSRSHFVADLPIGASSSSI